MNSARGRDTYGHMTAPLAPTGRPMSAGSSHLATLRQRLTEPSDTTIAGLGDSLTYGWMVARGFFDRVIDGLTSRFPAARISSVNAGIPGDTAAGGLGRIDALLDHAPHAVTVQFGLNDMYQGIAPDAFQTTVHAIATRLLDAGVTPLLVTSCPLRFFDGARLSKTFYDRIRAAADRADVPVVSLDHYWQDNAGPPRAWDPLLQADDVHPTDEGHRLMAQGLLDTLFPG